MEELVHISKSKLLELKRIIDEYKNEIKKIRENL